MPPKTYVYEPDGTGVSYWGVNIGNSGGRYVCFFLKAEPVSGGGMKIWTHYEARATGYQFGVMTTDANEDVQTNKGPARLAAGAAFAMKQQHDLGGVAPFYVPRPGQTMGSLTTGPGPILQSQWCHPSEICSGCDGRNDWLIVGAGNAATPGNPSSGGSNCTNYGMNNLAGGMGRRNQVFALDYGDTVAKPEEDSWTAPTWDADGNGRPDFARHADGWANVLFVGGSVRLMTPAEMDPVYQELRDRYWKP
jgi:prepilin-type processing-associated H-X9-DG protein